MINFREGWHGHLWQGRFGSFAMDEPYLIACVRYIQTNPMRAKLVEKPEDWPWSSASAHIRRENDRLVSVEPMLQMIPKDWKDFLSSNPAEAESELLRKHERTGRPLGAQSFVESLENILGCSLKPQKPGRKPKGKK